MNYVKAIITGLIYAAVFGCGDFADEGYQEPEIGTAEQPQTIKQTTNLSFGTRTATSATACDKTNAGQVCTMPTSKQVSYIITGTAAQKTAVSAPLVAISAQLNPLINASGWTVFQAPGSGEFGFEVQFLFGTCSGTGSSNIDGYVCATRSGGAVLTESLPGTYRTHATSNITVDLVDINARGATAGEDAAILKHALGHALLAHMGRGARTDVATAYSRRAVAPIQAMTPFSGGELCTVTGYQLSPAGSVTVGSGCGAD